MFSGTEIGLALTTLGSIAGAATVYFKTRGKSNGKSNGNGHFCKSHEAMVQNVDGVKDDVKEIKATLSVHTETITDIGRSTARIEGLLEGMARKK